MIDKLIVKLSKKIDKKYDVIIGLNRGGIIPSVLLSHSLGVKHGVTTIQSYNKREQTNKHKADKYISMIGSISVTNSILIVDDIADSGKTLDEVWKWIESLGHDMNNVGIATLYYKKQSKFKPTYYGKRVKNKEWVTFPWEKD